ncbi:MAG TPA: hypothetical protein VFC58_01865 [Desulfosporosinus sp.]|nr:hypothetical protein [Desulfosporosinus sp.]
MTGEEKKSAQYRKLVVDIKDDLISIHKIAGEINHITLTLKKEKVILLGADLMACAGYLHHYYTGVESIFERISRSFDGGLVSGGDYHRELLRSMTLEIPRIRPKTISKELAEELDEYRRFRHMFRHAYGSELRWRKMEPLASGIDILTANLQQKLFEFVKFVEKLSNGISPDY